MIALLILTTYFPRLERGARPSPSLGPHVSQTTAFSVLKVPINNKFGFGFFFLYSTLVLRMFLERSAAVYRHTHKASYHSFSTHTKSCLALTLTTNSCQSHWCSHPNQSTSQLQLHPLSHLFSQVA